MGSIQSKTIFRTQLLVSKGVKRLDGGEWRDVGLLLKAFKEHQNIESEISKIKYLINS
jgi:hypothetical protein